MITAMAERPILFSGPMVRAILDGRKTQTRRIVKPMPDFVKDNRVFFDDLPGEPNEMYCPLGTVGDRLWVRETFSPYMGNEDSGSPLCVAYKADGVDRSPFWKPSIHMPRWASRITLEITGVRVERLQDISEMDAMAEGCEPVNPTTDDDVETNGPCAFGFKLLWQSIYGPDSWDANPWVWVVGFKKM